MKKIQFLFFILLFINVKGFAQQQEEIDSLEQLLPTTKDSSRVNILNDLCLNYEYLDADKALKYGQEALALAKKIGHKRGEANVSMNLGLLAEDNSDYEKSEVYTMAALKIYQDLDQKADIA